MKVLDSNKKNFYRELDKIINKRLPLETIYPSIENAKKGMRDLKKLLVNFLESLSTN